MQEKMKEYIDQWLEHKKTEVKLAIFGYTEEDIKSNPEITVSWVSWDLKW